MLGVKQMLGSSYSEDTRLVPVSLRFLWIFGVDSSLALGLESQERLPCLLSSL